jgi:uncharacterized protein YgfB (UPF0149 family)
MRALMQTTSFAEIQRVLVEERSLTEAAEAHGTLAGSLCTAVGFRFEDWLLEILPDGRGRPESTSALRELYTDTWDSLEGLRMEFHPLLPEDEEPIGARTAALAQWCHGFLYGLGSNAIPDAAGIPGEVGEVVRDFTEITHADVDGTDSEEQNENAYAELVEFVRVGVQLVFDEFAGLRAQAAAPPQEPLH